MKLARLAVLALLTALAVAVLAGCGSSSSSSSASDPAQLVPASAPFYAEAVVRPKGKEAADVDAVLKKVLRTDDPAGTLRSFFDKAASKDGVSFAKDVEPWLGDRVGLAVTSLRGSNADAVVVIPSTDDGKAGAALKKTKGDIVQRTYKGIDYRLDRKDGTAAAVVAHQVVIGSEPAFKAAVDASKGQSLGDANALRTARAKVAQDRIGFLYLDVQGFLQAATQAASSDPQVGAIVQAFAGALPKTIAAALQADPDVIRIDAASIGTPKSFTSGGSGADMVASLPSDSWVALGVANLGQTIDRTLQAVQGAGGLTGVGVKALLGQLQTQTGLDLRRDVLAWMGDAGVFVTGTSSSDLGGALVVKTSDPAKTKATIAALRKLANGQSGGSRIEDLHAQGVDDGFSVKSSGGPRVDVALAGDKFVVAIGGNRVLAKAIAPGQGLGTAPAFAGAGAKLGGGVRPSFFLDMEQLTRLIGAFAGNSADFQKAKPYLDTFGAVVAGAHDEGGGVTRVRLLVTLK